MCGNLPQRDQEIAKSLMEKAAQKIVGIPMPVSVKAMIWPTYTESTLKAA